MRRGRHEVQVARAIAVLPGDKCLSEDDGNNEPSVSSFDRVVLTLNCVPGLNIFPTLSESDIAKGEPKKEAGDGEEVLWWDEEGVHDEEVHEELNTEKELSVAEGAEVTMASENLPISPALLAMSAQPVVFLDAELANSPEANGNSWYI